ncbi:MAG TPA: dephospho-CoA kinase [Kofleriaceae bacterium]|nr:dephospho-CoA kinase [Kofleriaceae bacterium]
MSNPYVIGLTGGIAAGKSHVAGLLRQHGAAIVDADIVARHVVQPGEPAYADIVAYFGREVLLPDGTLDRKRLGAIVYANAEARAALGRFTHPRIAAASHAQIAALGHAGAKVVFYEAALLVENQIHRGLAALIVVTTDNATQLRRVMARDGLPQAEAQARIDAQMPQTAKAALATWVIENNSDFATLAARVQAVISDVERRFGPIGR